MESIIQSNLNSIKLKMYPVVNEYVEIAMQFYSNFRKEFQSFNSTYKREIAFGTVMTINGAFVCLLLTVVFAFIKIAFTSIRFFAILLWDNLTPGQKWLELTMIVSSFVTFGVVAFAAQDMEKMIDDSFTKLKKEVADKTAIIAEQEAKIAEQEEKIVKLGGLMVTQVATDYINQKNVSEYQGSCMH